MKFFPLAFLVLMILALTPSAVLSQDEETSGITSPGVLISGYKGGLPFCTSFHQGSTTRLLLLKATKEIPELKHYLRIVDSQVGAIDQLELFAGDEASDLQRSKLLDANAAFDEDLIAPGFYSLLDEGQRGLLDRIALEVDGYSGLSRSSIADRLQLSQKTRKAIASTLVKFREELYLPYFRHCFAAKLPADHQFRDCEFNGRYLALLNQSLQACLSKTERKRLDDWTSQTEVPTTVIEAIKKKAPLPRGLVALAAAK